MVPSASCAPNGHQGFAETPAGGEQEALVPGAVDGIHDGLAFCKQLVREHRVGLVPGSAFNAAEEGWLRLCFASQVETLNTALDRLEDAIT